jgi:hypothetical protein
MALKYASVLKGAKDLLQKPFSFDNKVELKTATSTGAVFTADSSISGKDGSASGNLKVEYKKDSFSIDKLSVGTDKKVVGEFTLAEGVPNTDFTFKFSDGSRAADAEITASVGAVYKSADWGTYTVDADVLNGPSADVTGLLNFKNFLLGGSVRLNTAFGGDAAPVSIGDTGLLVGYKTGDFTAAVQETNCQVVDVSVVHKASMTTTAGFLASVPCCKETKKATTFTFGGSYKVDDSTTINAAADSAGKVSVAYKARLSALATVTASAQVDAANLGGDAHKLGLTLQLTSV